MDNSLTQAGSGQPQPRGLLASMRMFGRILDWLTALFELSADQQEDAGIYLGGRRRS